MKLNEYIKSAPILLDFPFDSEYAEEYINNYTFIDCRMKDRYGELPTVYNDRVDILNTIRAVLFLNKYKYDGLYATTKLVYNPIWNVEGTETTTTTHGATETKNNYGEKTTNNKYSEYPYDSKEKTTKTETDNVENSRTDTTNTEEYVDTIVLDRQGNIGVTSTQNLISQERECVNFVFWDIVISDVVKEITIPYYEGE